MLDDFSAFDSVCMESTIESSRENESEEICGKKKTKKKSHPLTHKQTLIIKSSLCIKMNVDDDDEVFSITERERDPARVF